MRFMIGLMLVLSTGGTLAADAPAVDTAALVVANSYPLTLADDGALAGPGADFLLRATANAQFVLFGESHHDDASPRFATALYRSLHDRYGFDTAVVELDPLAIEAVNKAPLRGDVAKIAALSKRYPAHLGFSSDQDLEFLAVASRIGRVWGVEQAQGATRYLEELAELAPNAAVKSHAVALRDDWSKSDAWLRPLLPAQLPQSPVLIDLHALKPYGRPLRETVAPVDQWQLRDLLQSYDAIVILPGSRKANWSLTGFEAP